MWPNSLDKYYSQFVKNCAFLMAGALLVIGAIGCAKSNSCGVVDQVFNNAGCKSLTLSSTKTFKPTAATCFGTGRKININCANSSGTQNQCAGIYSLPIFSLLVANNASGSFIDAGGTTYSTCSDLLTAYNSGTLVNVTGVYASDTTNSGDVVNCTAAGCTFNSNYCYAGWDSTALASSGTASLALGAKYLACTYIDTSSVGLTPIAVGAWASAPYQITIAGPLNFNSGWVDSQ